MAQPDLSSLTNGVKSVVAAAPESTSPELIHVSLPLMILTWVTFIILIAILYKIAWKPILTALDLRENRIRKSLEDAEKARAEAAASEERQKQLIRETEARTQKMLADAREAALETGRQMESQARDEARTLVTQAQQEIQGAAQRARADLRREAADLAIHAATRIIQENMDSQKNRELAGKLIQES